MSDYWLNRLHANYREQTGAYRDITVIAAEMLAKMQAEVDTARGIKAANPAPPDRLAPIEARGAVTDADWIAAANDVIDCLIQQRTVKSKKPFNSYGDCVQTRAHELAALSARESAPAVEEKS